MHKLAAATAAIALIAAAPAVAQDQDLPPIQRTDPVPHVPKKAKRMTIPLASAVTQARATKEQADTSKWPAGDTYDSVSRCKILSKRRGRCDYRLEYETARPVGEAPQLTWCDRRVTVLIAKKTHRVSSRVTDLGCETS